MKKLPIKERHRLLSIGFKQCSRCLCVYHKDFYTDGQFRISGRCYLCKLSYTQTNAVVSRGRFRKTPGQRNRDRFMEASGYRKCVKCLFTLPVTEYSSDQTTCNECGKKDVQIKKYIASFNLHKCVTCMGYREQHKFYRRHSGKYESQCRECVSSRLVTWKSENPDRYRNAVRNGQGRRRARIRNLHHKPITGEEYEILRAQRIKIFGE